MFKRKSFVASVFALFFLLTFCFVTNLYAEDFRGVECFGTTTPRTGATKTLVCNYESAHAIMEKIWNNEPGLLWHDVTITSIEGYDKALNWYIHIYEDYRDHRKRIGTAILVLPIFP